MGGKNTVSVFVRMCKIRLFILFHARENKHEMNTDYNAVSVNQSVMQNNARLHSHLGQYLLSGALDFTY